MTDRPKLREYRALIWGIESNEVGKLVTIEYDAGRARELAENIKRAGMTRNETA